MEFYVRIMIKDEFSLLDAETCITVNVGGQYFETTVQVLTVDPYSLLASCCRVKPLIQPGTNGAFYFDRDWWLFRHILSFLRSRKLPNELETLKELYKEASYYRLESLQRAIEAIPADQVVNYSPHITVTIPGARDGPGPRPNSSGADTGIGIGIGTGKSALYYSR
jgi:hypothetical protein